MQDYLIGDTIGEGKASFTFQDDGGLLIEQRKSHLDMLLTSDECKELFGQYLLRCSRRINAAQRGELTVEGG